MYFENTNNIEKLHFKKSVSIISSNVLYSEEGYENYQDLEISSSYDLVTSAVIYDATFIGYNSIVLGTFGRSVLFFCPTKTACTDINESGDVYRQANTMASELLTTDLSESGQTTNRRQPRYSFTYEFKREIVFKHSVLGLLTGLVSNNGALDLIILTLNGISVWQYDPEKVIELANKLFEQREHSESAKEQNANIMCSTNDLTTSF